MNNLNLTLIIRKDLELPPGLLAAQAAHLGAAFMLERIVDADGENILFEKKEMDWTTGPVLYVKSVNTFEELQLVMQKAKAMNINVSTWTDTIYSESLKSSINCVVGISLGPDDTDLLKQVGPLPLYK